MNKAGQATRQKQGGFAFLGIFIIIAMLAVTSALGVIGYKNFIEPKPTPSPVVSTEPGSGGTPGNEYVAMGDSYSGGWGADHTPTNPTKDKSAYDTSTQCLRNTKYSAQYLLAKDIGYKLVDASCGGSTTDNVLTVKQLDNPPQISKVTKDTKLVTLTEGGNDANLMGLLVGCMLPYDCTSSSYGVADISNRVSALPKNITAILTKITQIAPSAKIRWAGYPYIVSPPGGSKGTCSKFLNDGEQQLMFYYLTLTNTTIKKTVEDFAAKTGANAKYADPLAASSPFMQKDNGQYLDGCSSSANRYMNGPTDTEPGGWHPNIIGQKYYYEIYKASL